MTYTVKGILFWDFSFKYVRWECLPLGIRKCLEGNTYCSVYYTQVLGPSFSRMRTKKLVAVWHILCTVLLQRLHILYVTFTQSFYHMLKLNWGVYRKLPSFFKDSSHVCYPQARCGRFGRRDDVRCGTASSIYDILMRPRFQSQFHS